MTSCSPHNLTRTSRPTARMESFGFSKIDSRALFPGPSPRWLGRSPLLPVQGSPPPSSSPRKPHSFLSLNLCSHGLRDAASSRLGEARPRTLCSRDF